MRRRQVIGEGNALNVNYYALMLYLPSVPSQACQVNPTIRAKGIEYDSDIYERACALVQGSGLDDSRVQILHDNVLNIDFSEATCIFVYLVPEGMALLKQSFMDSLERNVRIVSYGEYTEMQYIAHHVVSFAHICVTIVAYCSFLYSGSCPH